MSKCSKKCNQLIKKIEGISGLDDKHVYSKLLEVEKILDHIKKYGDEDELNGTIFKDMII